MEQPRRFAVIGSPVGHSRSPVMHAAAFRALGMPHSYEKIETPPEEVRARVDAIRAGVFSGMNVTVPHKEHVLEFVDEMSERVRRIGASNTLVRAADGRVHAYNTDAPALRQELYSLAGVISTRTPDSPVPNPFNGRSVVVLGTGGAARPAIDAFAELGASRIIVRARNLARAAALQQVTTVPLEVQPLSAPLRERDDFAAVVHATTCGMQGGPPGDAVADAVAWHSVPRDAVALDVIYVPRNTLFLRRAEEHGLSATDGVGMLARQGALAFELWLGVTPPLDVMRQSLLKANP